MSRTLTLVIALLLTSSVSLQAAENDVLPDGTVFCSWEQPRRYSQTYHVAQGNPRAGDENPGTADRPWRTIGKAVATLQPGERVVVHRGVYREWVRPERGGTGPDMMIWYEAAPGEDVQLKGSDIWSPEWQATGGAWRAALDPRLFLGENPFALENFPVQPSAEWKRFPSMELRRGQVVLDGKPLMQVAKREELVQAEDSFWVEPDGKALQVRLAGGASPQGRSFELTCRVQVLAPVKRELNYIGVSGFRIFHAANAVPIPLPQRGALSATAGHHWIIEDCKIGWYIAATSAWGGICCPASRPTTSALKPGVSKKNCAFGPSAAKTALDLVSVK